MMDRATWIREKRRLAEVRMDTLFAHNYDEGWGHINSSHREFMMQFLSLCPPGCTILDMACGTGKYWGLILESGRSVLGVDQSQQMLLQAHKKFPNVPVEKSSCSLLNFQVPPSLAVWPGAQSGRCWCQQSSS
jgi:ubiquinone/menaquinone biosynthesis C-methylase UbiE